jgi:hypothetical protein
VRRAVAAGLALAALVLFALPRAAFACAGCRNPNVPITRLAATHLTRGELRMNALVSATSLNVVHEAGCLDPADCREVPAQPRFLHDQDIYPGELRTVVELGLTDSWGLEAQVSFRITKTAIRYTDLAGNPYQPLDPDVHHRDETLAGFGDPWLLGRWAGRWGGTAITARAGLSLPLGRTEPDPFALGAAGKRHQHIQFGSGTFDPIVMLDLARTVGAIDLGVYGQMQVTLHENDKGFRAGNRFFAGAQAGRRIFERLTGAIGLDVMSERPERWGGLIQQDGNLGRTDILGSVALTRIFGATFASVVARFPLYRHIVTGDEPAGRLSSPLMLTLILSRTFRPGAA